MEGKMKKLCYLLLFFALIVPAFAQKTQKRAFTIADLYRIKNVNDPQISPDGKKIAFVGTEYFLEEGKSNSEIYVMDADGDNLIQMTNNRASDNHPRWSPDGKSILFISTRNNNAQAWMLPVQGGEPHQVTDISTGVSNPTWLSDSNRFGFSSKVFPECGADDGCNQKLNTTMEEGPIQAHLADDLLFRHWNFWKDGKRTHTFVFNIEKDNYIDLTPGDYDAPSFSLGGGEGFAFSPDGKEICFVSNHDENEWETTNKDLWLVPTSGGQAVNITDENEAYDGSPAYSPDGRYIAYLMQTVPTYESDRPKLVIYNRTTKQKTLLTENFDNWVNSFQWAPDSRSLYFTADVQGHVPLYNVDIKTKRIRQVLDVKTIDAFDVSPDGKWVAFSRRAVGEPREIWRASTNGKNLQRLTFFNKPVEEEVDIRPAEEMWISSPTGKKIHTFVVKPHNFDANKKYPLILNVHGGPQSQWADAFRGDWQVYPGAGYIVAFPNPHGSTGYGQAFTEAISKDWGGKVYEDVMAVADSLAKISWVDEDRMGAMGWSYGGYMMMWLEGHTTRFKAIAAMMGVYNLTSFWGTTEELWFPQWDLDGVPWESELYEKWSPHKFASNFKTPCLVITGEHDYRVSYTQSLEFFTALQKQGVPSRLIVFKNDGHWPNYVKSMPLYYNAHLDWFHKYLGGDPAPYDMQKMVRNQAFENK
jgi:dipeptidyl aminopeptidase/acylaminoacyl peptidase